MSISIDRSFVRTTAGRMHVASAGPSIESGTAIVLLHQTPRSWDEYRDVIPLLAASHRVLAIDTPGFGDSERLPWGDNSIERWAEVMFEMLDAVGIDKAVIVGHHTGAATAVQMAASRPQRVAALVLSSCPYVDAARRAAHEHKRVIDDVEPRSDGSHLAELWQRRQPFYPAGNIELMQRFMIDAIKAGNLAPEGHKVVNRFVMEDRLPLITCPTLVIAAPDDPHAFPAAHRVAAAIKSSSMIEIEGGMVPLPDQKPEEFASAVVVFMARHAP